LCLATANILCKKTWETITESQVNCQGVKRKKLNEPYCLEKREGEPFTIERRTDISDANISPLVKKFTVTRSGIGRVTYYAINETLCRSLGMKGMKLMLAIS